ncbi:MAG: hypothetical protein R3F11_04735 [Verrucomicrobiales bacterium]
MKRARCRRIRQALADRVAKGGGERRILLNELWTLHALGGAVPGGAPRPPRRTGPPLGGPAQLRANAPKRPSAEVRRDGGGGPSAHVRLALASAIRASATTRRAGASEALAAHDGDADDRFCRTPVHRFAIADPTSPGRTPPARRSSPPPPSTISSPIRSSGISPLTP